MSRELSSSPNVFIKIFWISRSFGGLVLDLDLASAEQLKKETSRSIDKSHWYILLLKYCSRGYKTIPEGEQYSLHNY